MYSNLLNLLLFSFFFSFVKKEKGKRVVVNAGRRLRPKQERESQACLRAFFLSEKSALFDDVVSGFAAQCRGPAFFVYGRAAEGDVGNRRWTGRGWAAGGTRKLWAEQRRRNGAQEARERREEGCFSSSRGKIGGIFACSPGGSIGRSAAIAALGYRHRRENSVCADCGSVWEPSL